MHLRPFRERLVRPRLRRRASTGLTRLGLSVLATSWSCLGRGRQRRLSCRGKSLVPFSLGRTRIPIPKQDAMKTMYS